MEIPPDLLDFFSIAEVESFGLLEGVKGLDH